MIAVGLAFTDILKSESFRRGASLALLPALLGMPAVSYAGVAVVNLIWHFLFGRDSPALIHFSGGLLYGVIFGVLLQSFIFGMLGYMAVRFSPSSVSERLIKASSFVKAIIWIGMEVVVIPISFYMTMMAYGGVVFLSWLFDATGR